MARERIISVDSHANIPEERVLEQLPERFRGEYGVSQPHRQRLPRRGAVGAVFIGRDPRERGPIPRSDGAVVAGTRGSGAVLPDVAPPRAAKQRVRCG